MARNNLFAGSDAGAERAGIAYTILGCCRLADVKPAEYLGRILPQLARGVRLRDVPAMLPARYKAERDVAAATVATVGQARWPGDRPPEGWQDAPEPPGKHLRCVVSVGMLTEGWDAKNVTQILGLRAFSSQLLCEQVVGRGLRRMSYDVDSDTGLFLPEYCDVFGVPFEVIPVQGSRPEVAPPLPGDTLVEALDERAPLAIEFPRVEGYVVDVKERIRCDVDRVNELHVTPQVMPTSVVVKTQMGWAVKAGLQTTVGDPETLTREQFYGEHRLQRTAFEIARAITDVWAGGGARGGKEAPAHRHETARLLFPQVLAIVTEYVDRRVVLAPGARKEEVALAQYRDTITERLLTAIEPDEGTGEGALLPRIERHRPSGSTGGVQFRTRKPTRGTQKSHVSHVVLDSNFEGAAAHHLEQSDRVLSYVRNNHLGFEILYEWEGATRRYIPDFLAILDLGGGRTANLILEIKGYEPEQARAKHEGAERWVRAVNNHGGLGLWLFKVCRDPNGLARDLASWGQQLGADIDDGRAITAG